MQGNTTGIAPALPVAGMYIRVATGLSLYVEKGKYMVTFVSSVPARLYICKGAWLISHVVCWVLIS